MLRLICAVVIVGNAPSMAQDMSADTKMTPSDVSCADFAHNPDGSWTPSKTVEMGRIKLKAGKPLKAGTMVGGVDVAQHLTDECQKSGTST